MRLVSSYLPVGVELGTSDGSRGTTDYYLQCIGGSAGLAQLYLNAGLLHLEGAASTLLSASYSSLSSIRVPLQSQIGEGGTEAWKRDREAAARYFEQARALNPDLEIPSLDAMLPTELEIPSLDLAATSTPESVHTDAELDVPTIRRRRRKTGGELDIDDLVNSATAKTEVGNMEETWFMDVPSIVGAGTALLVLGVVGVLSLSNWSRRSQSA